MVNLFYSKLKPLKPLNKKLTTINFRKRLNHIGSEVHQWMEYAICVLFLTNATPHSTNELKRLNRGVLGNRQPGFQYPTGQLFMLEMPPNSSERSLQWPRVGDWGSSFSLLVCWFFVTLVPQSSSYGERDAWSKLGIYV